MGEVTYIVHPDSLLLHPSEPKICLDESILPRAELTEAEKFLLGKLLVLLYAWDGQRREGETDLRNKVVF
jgi:hypothetical protein